LLDGAHPIEFIGRGGVTPGWLRCRPTGVEGVLRGVMGRLTAALIVSCCALLGAAVASAAASPPPLTPGPPDALTGALESGRLSEARYALERARSLFAIDEVRKEFGQVAAPSPHDATPLLRDLAARRDLLRGEDRARAAAILARPPADDFTCDAGRSLCFHWRTSGRHATSPPDVNKTVNTFAAVWDLEVGTYGYLAPLPDSSGGGPETDIYFRDLGGNKAPLFGYCTTDDPNATPSNPFTDVSAYCVVDNDFADFGTSQTPDDFRGVTAAHEFFHAIQFAYDWLEDLWLMEGTAMFMEGQFRPDVDDRILYLGNSVLISPRTPLDRGADGFEYGAWIYWRFLVEHFGELDDPLIIRHIWERAAGASADTDGLGPDRVAENPYSTVATRKALADRGGSFRPIFAKFAQVNRVPAKFYDEGASYPRAPAGSTRTMSRSETTGWRSTSLYHLANAYYSFVPAAGTGAGSTLRVFIDLPQRRLGPAAGTVIVFNDGSIERRQISLDASGNGSRTVPFGPGTVKRVDLVLSNSSTRMDCDRGTPFSCEGVGLDDLRPFGYRARAS
jgi:hypothetical protein